MHQEPVGEAASDGRVHRAVVAGHDPDDRADRHRDDRGGEPDEQRDPRSLRSSARAPSCRPSSVPNENCSEWPARRGPFVVTVGSRAHLSANDANTAMTTKNTRMPRPDHPHPALPVLLPDPADSARRRRRPLSRSGRASRRRTAVGGRSRWRRSRVRSSWSCPPDARVEVGVGQVATKFARSTADAKSRTSPAAPRSHGPSSASTESPPDAGLAEHVSTR